MSLTIKVWETRREYNTTYTEWTQIPTPICFRDRALLQYIEDHMQEYMISKAIIKTNNKDYIVNTHPVLKLLVNREIRSFLEARQANNVIDDDYIDTAIVIKYKEDLELTEEERQWLNGVNVKIRTDSIL